LQREWDRTAGEGFTFEIVERVAAEDLAALGDREAWWMERLGAHHPSSGYNSQPGGMSIRPRRAPRYPGRVGKGELTKALGVTARNVTTIVDGLEREGLLARTPDPTDRRAILLELTPKGCDPIAAVHATQRELADWLFESLDTMERAELLRLPGKILEAASASGAPPDCPSRGWYITR
jgi:DNA-binding MarR family transcriptional regulator